MEQFGRLGVGKACLAYFGFVSTIPPLVPKGIFMVGHINQLLRSNLEFVDTLLASCN